MIATVDLFKGSNFDYMATPLRDEQLLELRAHQDENYEHLKTTIIKDGWPDKQIDLHPDLETFWSHRDDLSIDNDGFIVKNGHLLVPAGLCQTYLQRMLAMHQQAEKMEARARKSICSHSSQETSRTLPKRVYPVKKSYQARHRSRNAPTRKHTTHSTPCTRISRATKNDNSWFWQTNFPVSLTSGSGENTRRPSKSRTSSCCSSLSTAHWSWSTATADHSSEMSSTTSARNGQSNTLSQVLTTHSQME